MAARRALDATGLKLGLKGWHALTLQKRQKLAQLGSGVVVDTDAVAAALAGAALAPQPMQPLPEPLAVNTPKSVTDAFGPGRSIPDATWSALSPLDRYVLSKVATRGRAERLQSAYDEIVGLSASSTHLAPGGGVRMVSVGQKIASLRTAKASTRVSMSAEAFARLEAGDAPKGDARSQQNTNKKCQLYGMVDTARLPFGIVCCL